MQIPTWIKTSAGQTRSWRTALIGACLLGVFLGVDGLAHDDALPGKGKVPLHARDSMRAFADEHHHNEHLAAQAVTACSGGFAGSFPCSNVDLMAFLPLDTFSQGNGNDIWGWTDAGSGREFAIMGLTNGTVFVEVSDPVNPVYLGFLPRPLGVNSSSWRDVKVFNDHAFVGSEANSSGLQVMDLTQLLAVSSPPVTFNQLTHYTGAFLRSHNIVINEASGYAFGVGANSCSGGLAFVDILNPGNPQSAGCYSGDGYTHDAQCVVYSGPDSEHQGKEICFAYNENSLTIVDVSNKSAPQQISRSTYARTGYTHQGWLTEDQQYLLMDDETDELDQPTVTQTRTLIWDVRDLDNPVHLADHEGVSTSIDHNQYVVGTHAFQANYRSGLRILDISDIANGNLSEVAFFDVYPANDSANFNGAWSVYPFFASGTVVVSGIEQGLFVLRPNLGTPSDPPQVTVLNPPNGASNLGGTIQVQIDATDSEDADGTLNVQFNIDSGAWQNTGYVGGLYVADWNSASVLDGSHTLNARAIDSDLREGHDSTTFTTANGTPKFTVDSVSVSIIPGNGNRHSGEALVAVSDASGDPLAGVSISGSFSGDWNGTRSGSTDADGKATFNTPRVKNMTFVGFCVDSATLTGWEYDAAASVTCGDSNGGGTGPTGSITGSVTDAGNSLPIPDAGVSTETGQSATTNGAGQFSLANVPVGNRNVSVTANGYAPDSKPATVTESATTTVDFQLTAQSGGAGAIRGTVYSATGGKLSGVSIQVLAGSSATTNKGGKYNIQGVAAGARMVTASKPGFMSQTRQVDVVAGSTVTSDFTLAPNG